MVFPHRVSNFVKRNSLVIFFVLAFGISWLGFFTGATLLFPFGPSAAGVILVLLTYNPEDQREFWRRVIDFKRISTGWYLLIILISPALIAASIIVDRLLGGSLPEANLLGKIADQPLKLLPFVLTSLVFGALSEELGWRGYALAHVPNKWGAIRSSLMIGIIWWAWHLPLFTAPGSAHEQRGWFTMMFWLFLIDVISLSILLTWVYLHNRASILAAILLHFFYNFTLGLVWPVSDRTQLFISILLILAAASLAWLKPAGPVIEREASAQADTATVSLPSRSV
jgi:membrane protease YdiL (CAAX protease family)